MRACADSGSEHSGGGEGEAEEGTPRGGQPRQWVQVAVLLGFWGVFVAFQLLLSRWPRCSGPYWAIFSLQAGLCLVAECVFIRLVSAAPISRLSSSGSSFMSFPDMPP